MLCRQCGVELVPFMVTEMGAKKETQWKRSGELSFRCPNGCKLCQHETASWQKLMKNKPQPQIPKPAL